MAGACIPCTHSSASCPLFLSTFVSFNKAQLTTGYPETRGVPLEEMDKLFGDEVVESDDSEDEEDDEQVGLLDRPPKRSYSP